MIQILFLCFTSNYSSELQHVCLTCMTKQKKRCSYLVRFCSHHCLAITTLALYCGFSHEYFIYDQELACLLLFFVHRFLKEAWICSVRRSGWTKPLIRFDRLTNAICQSRGATGRTIPPVVRPKGGHAVGSHVTPSAIFLPELNKLSISAEKYCVLLSWNTHGRPPADCLA